MKTIIWYVGGAFFAVTVGICIWSQIRGLKESVGEVAFFGRETGEMSEQIYADAMQKNQICLTYLWDKECQLNTEVDVGEYFQAVDGNGDKADIEILEVINRETGEIIAEQSGKWTFIWPGVYDVIIRCKGTKFQAVMTINEGGGA